MACNKELQNITHAYKSCITNDPYNKQKINCLTDWSSTDDFIELEYDIKVKQPGD